MKTGNKIQGSLESKRPTFFLIGLISSLLMVIAFFNLSSIKTDARSYAMPTEYAEFIEIPITSIKQKKEIKQIQKASISTDPIIKTDPFEIIDEPLVDEKALVSDSVIPEKIIITEKDIFRVVEEMPQFPGGEQELFEFLGENTRYPRMALQSNVHGIVHVNFIIGKDGFVEEATVLRGIGAGCDEEAIRVLMSMPRWSPGKQRGKAVRVQFSIPIQFNLID